MDAKLWGQEDEQVQPKKSSFSDIFDNIGAWGRAAYADTMAIPMGRQIKDVYDKIENGQYSSREEYDSLVADLDRLQNERNEYRDAFNENQKILNQNDSYLKDFTEIGGTVQGIGRQARDTLIGAGLGAIGGSVVPVAGTASGAMTGARIGNFIGSIDQAAQDADTNAIDAWEKVLQEGGTSEQAEQAYKDAFWNNMPTEALDILSSLYMGGKLLGSTSKILNRALGGKLAGTLANGVNKAARFDLPAKLGTYVANKSGQAWLGQGVGVGLGMLGNAVEEGIQEPWQDYATERAVDIQRRQYDPTHEGIRDFSIFGDGGLLDYYTTPEGMNTAIKAAKMGAAFGGVGGLMSKSQYTELGTAHSDSIQSAKREADWIDKQGLLKDEGNLERYNNVKETMANIYDLSEDEKADLSVEDVARMYHEYYTNLFGQGGNRQEQNAVSQADLLNEITGEETARRGLMGDTATKYIDEFGIRPDNETLVGINDNQQELSEEQVQEALEQDEEETTGEETESKEGIKAKASKPDFFNDKTSEQAKEEQASSETQNVIQKKKSIPDKFGNWKKIEEDDEFDHDLNNIGAEAKYENTKTGRIANIKRTKAGYQVTDVTDPKDQGTTRNKKGKKKLLNFLNSSFANQKTKFMSDGTQEQEQVSQALPQEDGVIANKGTDITTDENGEQWFNGKKIQSNKAQTIHSMQDLHDYYKTHKDLMSKDLYAEISRQMMRFGIGNANNTEIVLDLTNREAGGFGSETTIRTDPNDENSAVAKAIVRLYAGADLATAAHEMAHLGWMNLSDQDRATFTKWAEKTQGEFIAKILGMDYDQNFRSYLIEALTNRESQTSQDLWAKIKREGAVQQTLGILNGQNYGLAVEERFAWEFSNWYAQGYIKGAKPRNIIERILNKACATLQGALNLLSDTNRYLNGENGYNGGDINNIFTNMSTRGIGQHVAPQVELRTEMTQPIQESPYNLGQGVDETFEEGLYNSPQQNLGRNTGTVGAQTYATPQVEQKPKQDLSRNTGNVPKMARTEGVTRKPTKYTPPPTVDQRVEQMNRGLQNEYLDIDNTQTSPVYNNLAPSADEEYAMDVMKNADKTEGLEAMQKKEAAEREKAEKQARAEAEKQRKAREKEKRDKLNALNKDVKDKIATANKSLNAKKKQPSIEEIEKQINEAEKALVNFENEEYTLRMIDNPNQQISPQDKKTFNEYYHAIDDMRKRLNDIKQSQEQNKSVEKVNLTSDNQNATMVANQDGQEVADNGETEDTRGTEDLQGNVGEVQGRGGVRQGNDNRTGEGRVRQDAVEGRSEGNGKDISLLKDKEIYTTYNKRKEKKTELKDWRNMSGDDKLKQVYVDALNASKEADTQHGVYVDGQTVESLKDCKVVLHKNKMAGFAITKDGNIVGVFSNPKNPIRGILNDMIFIAHMMGGNRMDCFGKFLLRGYRNCGFTPVARTTFAEEYYPADNPANTTIRKEKPDVFFLVKDNDNNNTYLNKVENDIYANDAIEAESVPLIDSEDSYSDALDFQGQVLKEIRKKSNANKSTKEVADSLRPKEQTVTETQETTEQTKEEQTETPIQSSTVEQPVTTKSEPVVAKNETTENENTKQTKEAMEQQMLLNREIDDIKGDHSDGKISYEEALNKFNEVEKEINSLQFPESEQGRISNLLDNLKFARMIAESDNRRLHPEIEQAEKQKKIEEENKEYGGFLDNMSPMTRGKTIKQLSQERNYGKDGGIMTKKAFIEKEVKNDSVFLQYITGDGYYLQYDDGTQRKIQHTDAEYYNHLSNQIREKEEAEKEKKRREKRKDMPEDRWSKYRNKDGNIESDSEGVYHYNGDEIESPIFDIYDDPDSVSNSKDYIDALVSYDPSGKLLSNLKKKINDYQNTKNPVGEVEYWDEAIEAIEEEQENRRDNDGYVSTDDNGSPWTSRMIMDNMKEHAQYLQEQNEEETEIEEQTSPQTKTIQTINEGNIENNEKTQPLTQRQNQTNTEAKKATIDKSDKNYQKAIEMVLKYRGMSPVGLRFNLKEEQGIDIGYVKAEQYLAQMEEDGLVEGAGEGSMRIPVNNPSIKMQSEGEQNNDSKTIAREEENQRVHQKIVQEQRRDRRVSERDTGLNGQRNVSRSNAQDNAVRSKVRKDNSSKNRETSTRFQEAGQNAKNQTLLTPQIEKELEDLFWKFIRKKQFHGMDSRWKSGDLDYYKSLSNRRQSKEFNPEFIREDKAYLDAIKNINDYIHEKFPEYKNIYRGVDGHWRFEFSDKDAKFINGFEKLSGKTLETTLEKILKHDNLYKFYDKLKGMPVRLVRNTEMQRFMDDYEHEYYAAYDPETKSIYINSDMFENNDEARNSLLHEIQHAIQDIEGFANGTSENALNNDYSFSEGEKQAGLTEKRSNMSDEELQKNPRSKTLNTNEKTIIEDQRPVQKVVKSPSTKMQSNGQNNLGYIDKQKDIYSVTFTKSAQQNAENKKKMDFYRKNKSYWRENKDAQTGSITFTRALPYQQHQKTIIYDEINGKKVGKRKKAKWREYYEAFKDHMIKWLFNDKHFLEKAARNVGAIESYMRMMVMKDQGAVAGAAIEDGIVKHNGKNGERTKSLNSIIEAVGEENQTDFLNYCEAYRVLDLEKRNIYQKMTPDDARKEIAKVKRSKNAKLFEEQRKNFVEYNHELLWILVDGGFITEQQYDKFIANDPNFIPLAKNMDELEGYVDGFRDSKTMINVAHPMHKIGTSMREVANPFLEMQKRTVEYYVKASRNKAGHIFVHDIAEAIAQNAKGDVVAQNQGMVRKLASRDKNGKPISHDNKQYVFYVWENGEKQYYQVADREIYVALKSFDAEQMGALSKIMNATAGKASRLVRNTATMTPDFGLRNLVRDNMEAFISSEHGFLPLVDSLWGMYQMANDTQWFKEYQRMNGEHLSLNRDGEDVATVEHDIKDNVKFYKTIVPLFKKDLREFMDKDRSMPARAKSLLKLVATDIVPLQSIYKANKRLNDYLETGTRIGEYRNARMGYKGLKGRLFETSGSTVWTTDMDLSRAKNTEMIAAYKSKDITLNFGQHGVLGKELNRYIPFFNASLQGIYKLGNTLDDMIHAEDARRRQELMFKCALMGAMGMAAALAGQGDDDYDEAPDYEHENFWILPNGIRIPKDQLFGKLIGGTVEKATAQYLKDGDVKKLELVQDILGNFAIDKCVPALVDLGWGTIGNYDSFKKKSVTPEYMADKLGYLQKDLSTSKAGADISKAIFDFTKGVFGTPVDVGAKKVDFVISKTLSNLGKYATSLWELTGENEKMTRGAEAEDKGGFAETSKELPYPLNQVVGTFATNRNSFQSISDFYERHRELKKLSSDESIMSKNEKKAWEAYQAAYKKDKQYRDALRAIKLDKSLTGAQKRQKADKIFKQQISMARKLHDWEKKHGLV